MKQIKEESLIQPSIDMLMEHIENKYVLSLITAKRARDLFNGEEPLIDEFHINKVTTAINEINDGKVWINEDVTDLDIYE